jgi:dTDP-glucose 4,6-dehydratase
VKIIITGGLGFIGKNLIMSLNGYPDIHTLNLDAHTYAVEDKFPVTLAAPSRHQSLIGNICNEAFVKSAFEKFRPDLVLNLSAESHVDRSISEPERAINQNVLGVTNLLKVSHQYLLSLPANSGFRFYQFSTDEVYGDLNNEKKKFSENSEINPSSPYSASKAAGDMIVKAWHRTYGMPFIITRCSNNYGPFQSFDKFIPKLIANLVRNKTFGVYGDGSQERDWLYVGDCIDAIEKIIFSNIVNDIFNIGTGKTFSNKQVVEIVIGVLSDELKVDSSTLKKLIKTVGDRPGHDNKYCVNSKKLSANVGWLPKIDFETGIKKTVNWYLKQQILRS